MLQQANKFVRMLVGVVLVLEHDIFEGDAPRIRRARIGGAGFEQFVDAVFLVERHDLVADFLGHRVERNRQVHADFFPAAFHCRNDTAGRERDAPLRQGQAFAIHDELEGTFDIVEII